MLKLLAGIDRVELIASDHRVDKLLGSSLACYGSIYDLAAAHDYDTIGAGGDIGEFVSNEYDRFAFHDQRADETVKTLGLARCQYRGRLIEYDYAGIEIEHFG